MKKTNNNALRIDCLFVFVLPASPESPSCHPPSPASSNPCQEQHLPGRLFLLIVTCPPINCLPPSLNCFIDKAHLLSPYLDCFRMEGCPPASRSASRVLLLLVPIGCASDSKFCLSVVAYKQCVQRRECRMLSA